jgi:hypothetical protein
MNAPRVSVIIACHNYAPYVGQAIESVLSQSFNDFELLVLDDGSTDESLEVAAAYQSRDSRVRVWHQSNRGVTATLNRLSEQARGDLIANLDADNWWMPHLLHEAVSDLDAHPDRVASFSSYRAVDNAGIDQPDHCYVVSHDLVGKALAKRLVVSNCLNASTAVFRRKALGRLPMARNHSHVYNWDLWLRLSLQGSMKLSAEVRAFYRCHGHNMSIGAEQTLRTQQLAVIAELSDKVMAHHGFGEPTRLMLEGRLASLELGMGNIERALHHFAYKQSHGKLTLNEGLALASCLSHVGRLHDALDVAQKVAVHQHRLPPEARLRLQELRKHAHDRLHAI